MKTLPSSAPTLRNAILHRCSEGFMHLRGSIFNVSNIPAFEGATPGVFIELPHSSGLPVPTTPDELDEGAPRFIVDFPDLPSTLVIFDSEAVDKTLLNAFLAFGASGTPDASPAPPPNSFEHLRSARLNTIDWLRRTPTTSVEKEASLKKLARTLDDYPADPADPADLRAQLFRALESSVYRLRPATFEAMADLLEAVPSTKPELSPDTHITTAFLTPLEIISRAMCVYLRELGRADAQHTGGGEVEAISAAAAAAGRILDGLGEMLSFELAAAFGNKITPDEITLAVTLARLASLHKGKK